MKVGIIRCMQTEDYCPGTTDFKAIREKTGVFEGVEGGRGRDRTDRLYQLRRMSGEKGFSPHKRIDTKRG